MQLPRTLARLNKVERKPAGRGGAELRTRGCTMMTSGSRIYHDEARHGVAAGAMRAILQPQTHRGRVLACGVGPSAPKLRVFVSSASHQVGMAAVAATWPTSGVRVALLPAWRARSANWAELITAAPPGSLLK